MRRNRPARSRSIPVRVPGRAAHTPHRDPFAAVAAGGLDTLPHNDAVITRLAICGLARRDAYLGLAMAAMRTPLIALRVLGTLSGSFCRPNGRLAENG